MGKNLFSYSLFERFKLSRSLAQVAQKYGSPPWSTPQALEEAIETVKKRVTLEPNEWLFWHALADYNFCLSKFLPSIDASEVCNTLRPLDPRSAYSLGTVYRELTNARYVGNPKFEEVLGLLNKTDQTNLKFTDPDPAKRRLALDTLGLTIQQAAQKSIELFKRVLTMDIDYQSRLHVEWIINSMESTDYTVQRSVPE